MPHSFLLSQVKGPKKEGGGRDKQPGGRGGGGRAEPGANKRDHERGEPKKKKTDPPVCPLPKPCEFQESCSSAARPVWDNDSDKRPFTAASSSCFITHMILQRVTYAEAGRCLNCGQFDFFAGGENAEICLLCIEGSSALSTIVLGSGSESVYGFVYRTGHEVNWNSITINGLAQVFRRDKSKSYGAHKKQYELRNPRPLLLDTDKSSFQLRHPGASYARVSNPCLVKKRSQAGFSPCGLWHAGKLTACNECLRLRDAGAGGYQAEPYHVRGWMDGTTALDTAKDNTRVQACEKHSPLYCDEQLSRADQQLELDEELSVIQAQTADVRKEKANFVFKACPPPNHVAELVAKRELQGNDNLIIICNDPSNKKITFTFTMKYNQFTSGGHVWDKLHNKTDFRKDGNSSWGWCLPSMSSPLNGFSLFRIPPTAQGALDDQGYRILIPARGDGVQFLSHHQCNMKGMQRHSAGKTLWLAYNNCNTKPRPIMADYASSANFKSPTQAAGIPSRPAKRRRLKVFTGNQAANLDSDEIPYYDDGANSDDIDLSPGNDSLFEDLELERQPRERGPVSRDEHSIFGTDSGSNVSSPALSLADGEASPIYAASSPSDSINTEDMLLSDSDAELHL